MAFEIFDTKNTEELTIVDLRRMITFVYGDRNIDDKVRCSFFIYNSLCSQLVYLLNAEFPRDFMPSHIPRRFPNIGNDVIF